LWERDGLKILMLRAFRYALFADRFWLFAVRYETNASGIYIKQFKPFKITDMAILTTETSIKELRERFGDTVNFYERNGKKIMASWPDFHSAAYKNRNNDGFNRLVETHKIASKIYSDPVVKAEYKEKCKPGEKAYFLLLKELLSVKGEK
jgi:hypothetical protein